MIEAKGLTRRFGQRTAVDNLSFAVGRGEILGLLGPNGAGKTTTIRMLAGIIAPSAGTAEVAGLDPARQPERVHEHIGLLTEAPGFYERLSARRNLSYFAGFYPGLDVRQAVAHALETMGLADRSEDRVGTFSKGMKQRLALARALLHGPEVLFLDEPTAGLDPEAAKDFRQLIGELKEDGRTVLLSTHNLTEAELLSDWIAVFRSRLVALDTADALRAQQFERAIRIRLAAAGDELAAQLDARPFVRGVRVAEDDRTVLVVHLEDADRDRPALVAEIVSAGGEILEVAEERRSLEEIYLRLVREDES